MASVTKLNVCEVREYARKSMNPETGDEKRWYDVQVTTAESFAGFKYDGDTKVEADVNALTKSAKTWLYAFTATADDVVACYNLLNEERLNSASDAAVALEVRLMLKGATIAIESTKYEVGDDYEGEVVEQPFYTRSVTTVIPGKAYMTHVFSILRTNGVLDIIGDSSATDVQLAEKWVAKQKALLKLAK